jgi:hypothetical protein
MGDCFEVRAGAKGSVVSEKDRHSGIRVTFERSEGIRQGLGRGRIDRVPHFRSAQNHRSDDPLFFDPDGCGAICHKSPFQDNPLGMQIPPQACPCPRPGGIFEENQQTDAFIAENCSLTHSHQKLMKKFSGSPSFPGEFQENLPIPPNEDIMRKRKFFK